MDSNSQPKHRQEKTLTTIKRFFTLDCYNQCLLPLLSSIPLNRFCPITVSAAADAFATNFAMGIGGWVSIYSSTFLVQPSLGQTTLLHHLPVHKDLRRYITSWEAFAQLCILLTLHKQCEPRPGLISLQSGSDNTGAKTNINHGFSNTEILADITIISIAQLRCNKLLDIHRIPGEKNIDADDLSRGKISCFRPNLRIEFQLSTWLDNERFPKYINDSVQLDPDIRSQKHHSHVPSYWFYFFLSPGLTFTLLSKQGFTWAASD